MIRTALGVTLGASILGFSIGTGLSELHINSKPYGSFTHYLSHTLSLHTENVPVECDAKSKRIITYDDKDLVVWGPRCNTCFKIKPVKWHILDDKIDDEELLIRDKKCWVAEGDVPSLKKKNSCIDYFRIF